MCNTLIMHDPWPITDTDSVLCTLEDHAVLQRLWNTITAPQWQFRLWGSLSEHKRTYLLTYKATSVHMTTHNTACCMHYTDGHCNISTCRSADTYITRLVVLAAVGKHEVEVINALLTIHVVEWLQTLPYRAQVHRICYYFVVVLAPTHHWLVTHHTSMQLSMGLTNSLSIISFIQSLEKLKLCFYSIWRRHSCCQLCQLLLQNIRVMMIMMNTGSLQNKTTYSPQLWAIGGLHASASNVSVTSTFEPITL